MEAAPGFDDVRPISTIDALARTLRQQILEGSIPPGTQLREAEISNAFRVSRHSVRSALQQLVHEGLALHAANRGVFVPEFTIEEIGEMFRFREILEVEAVKQVAAGEADLGAVHTAVGSLQSLPSDADWAVVRDADLAVHRALIYTLENARITRTFETLIDELRLSLLHLRPEFEHRAWVVRQHADLLAALEAKDVERAVAWIRNHNSESIADITESLQEDQASERPAMR
jgi:DNA-binding GntR family transcriptional regulator